MLGIHTILGRFFILGDEVSRFFESPENQGKDMLLYSITSTTVVGWGLCGTFLLLLSNLHASKAYKTAFIVGGKVALVKELFCGPLLPIADELNCFYDVRKRCYQTLFLRSRVWGTRLA